MELDNYIESAFLSLKNWESQYMHFNNKKIDPFRKFNQLKARIKDLKASNNDLKRENSELSTQASEISNIMQEK